MGNTVKTYRVLHAEGLRVGDEVRLPGDFIPEAAGFGNLRSYLNTHYIEEVFVDEEALKIWREEFDARLLEDKEDETEEQGEVDPDDSNRVEEDKEDTKPKPKKRAVKKAPKGKRTVKKTTSKEKNNGKELAEQSV